MSWVAVEGVRVNYGRHTVLDGIDVTIPQGEIVAILGPSGCGKTTLLRSIAGLLPVSEGSISLGAGDVVRKAQRRSRAPRHWVGTPGLITVSAPERWREHWIWHPPGE